MYYLGSCKGYMQVQDIYDGTLSFSVQSHIFYYEGSDGYILTMRINLKFWIPSNVGSATDT